MDVTYIRMGSDVWFMPWKSGQQTQKATLGRMLAELIAELVSEYHETVPPEKHCKDDQAFIERLYCEFGGYCDVYLGINP